MRLDPRRTDGTPGRRKPPPLVERILRWCLPDGIVGDSIIGDLREEFSSDLRSNPPGRATLLYLRKAISVGLRFTGRSRPPTPGQKNKKRDLGGTMSAVWHDVRQAFRLLIRKPGLTLAATFSLGLGIGANTAIFSLVNTILLKPLPYPDSHELVEAFRIDEAVTGLEPTAGRVSNLWAVPYQVHQDWLEMGPVIETGGGYAGAGVTLQQGDESSSLPVLLMTSGAFQALGVQPEMGRTFLPEDDEVGAPPVAVLSFGLWQSLFGGDPDILGTQIHLNDTAYTITGVMPQGFAFPSDSYRLWTSFSDDQKTSPTRNAGYMKVVARLSPGVTLDQARREMDQVSARIGELHPEEAEHRVGLFPQKAMVVGDSGAGLLVLLGSLAGLAALLAIFGVYGVLAYLVQLRSREIGIQLALGAEQRRVLGTVLRRGLFMGGLGLGAGILMAIGLGRVMQSQLFGVEPWDPATLGAAGVLLLGATLAASYLPARKAARVDPVQILKGG